MRFGRLSWSCLGGIACFNIWAVFFPAVFFPAVFFPAVFFPAVGSISAEDWPMWRMDAGRSAASSESLPGALVLQWALKLPEPRPAWHDGQGKLQFDASYLPIVAGGRMIVASMVGDHVSAYDTETGRRLWRYYAGGPVRLAPVAYKDRVLFGSDDGHLYCLNIDDGKLIWKFRGGPSDRMVLGNDRLVSMWPVRGAPVVADGVVYYSAGIWPFMGTFIHAIDVDTGKPIWTNSGSGSDYIIQQHNSPAFSGVAPQGYLTVAGDTLLVAGGRTVPAAYDRRTGKLLFFRPGDRDLGKDSGGYDIIAGSDWYANGRGIYRLRDGQPCTKLPRGIRAHGYHVCLVGSTLIGFGDKLIEYEEKKTDKEGKVTAVQVRTLKQVWRASVPESVKQIHLVAGDCLLASDKGSSLCLMKLVENGSESSTRTCDVVWEGEIQGDVWDVVVADQRLFVTNTAGTIFCFGSPQENKSPTIWDEAVVHRTVAGAVSSEKSAAETQRLSSLLTTGVLQTTLNQSDVFDGYAVLQGEYASLAQHLVRVSKLHVIVLEKDGAKAQTLREEFDRAQLLGRRVAVVEGDVDDGILPSYMANLLISGIDSGSDMKRAIETSGTMAEILRPYTGIAILYGDSQQIDSVRNAFRSKSDTEKPLGSFTIGVPGKEQGEHFNWTARGARRVLAESIGIQLDPSGDSVLLKRNGPLPGAGTWTHQNGDAGNTLVSSDIHPRTPLGMLWFGGPSNRGVLPRHGHGPTPQIIGGRLFIEGGDMLRAVDVYTGLLLWQREFDDVGVFYDVTAHQPGAGAVGGNFACTRDAVYLVWRRSCLKLDPATGETIATFHLPPGASGVNPYWGYIAVYGDVLVGGSSPMVLFAHPSEAAKKRAEAKGSVYTRFGEGSKRLVAMNRHDGRVLWTRDAVYNFRHNAIAIGDDMLFCLDRMTTERLASLRRRGGAAQGDGNLAALELQTGNVVWETTDDAFGTWLAYNSTNRLLLQGGSRNRDRGRDEIGSGMSVHVGSTGEMLWKNELEYGGPPLFYSDKIITQPIDKYPAHSIDPQTGQPKQRVHPLTGESTPWRFSRNYGCNTAIGCPNLLTFRSAAAGYFDLQKDGGTGNFGGFRTGCTSNLIAADGILNSPDYTRTCTCSYQNQCSVALVHMPEVEMWTFNPMPANKRSVKRVGINFGAPGDRLADNGVLWLEYPGVGGPSPEVGVQLEGKSVEYERQHAAVVENENLGWVYASGVRGAQKIHFELAGGKQSEQRHDYSIRMFFCDPEQVDGSVATLNIRLQGKVVVPEFDVLAAEGRYRRGIELQLDAKSVANSLEISFERHSTSQGTDRLPLLSGIEIVQKDQQDDG